MVAQVIRIAGTHELSYFVYPSQNRRENWRNSEELGGKMPEGVEGILEKTRCSVWTRKLRDAIS
jgi:hypothetical protein